MKTKRNETQPARLPLLISVAVSLALALQGCANGKWNTSSTTTNAALSSATTALAADLAAAAAQVAQGSSAKTALVQATGDAVRSLEGVAITAVHPVVTERLLKWVPRNAEWQGYAKSVASAIDTYVQAHGNTPAVLKSALEAAAMALNTY